ncbi:MAG: DUF4071 domain-containing protein [Nitrospiraceae bacterium]|nr:MAG: DUF4071 domain-containing protein [Nitrospiraceae bacterium]
MRPEDYLVELKNALDEYRFRDVRSLTDKIDPTEFQDKQIKIALRMIRGKRLFAELERAASRFALVGRGTYAVRRQWAQALLDQNLVLPALNALQAMSPEVKTDPVEGSEVQGLIGRAYKQLYVNEGNPENLVRAIQAYTPCWKARQADYRWHGINLTALLVRAHRDGIDPKTSDDPLQIAREIREEIEESSSGGVWDYGTAMEASVTLGDEKSALTWASKYVRHPEADAFELGSTLRQLREVWLIEENALGRKLVPVIEYALMSREGSRLEPTALKVSDPTGFEAVWGSDSYVRLQWMDTMYQRCASVARVEHATTGDPHGTGFLVRGDSLSPNWGEKPVFVTNAHVVSNDPLNESLLQPADAVAKFTRLPNFPPVKLGELLFSSSRARLDVSILRIEAPAEAAVLTSADYLTDLPQAGGQLQRLYVIGHPRGGELAVSLYDNSLVGYEGDYVHYRSPTEGGHSGSPVFTRQWKLLALHHRAREELQVNEGVCFDPICAAARGNPRMQR